MAKSEHEFKIIREFNCAVNRVQRDITKSNSKFSFVCVGYTSKAR